MGFRVGVVLCLTSLCCISNAEYRAFLLKIATPSPAASTEGQTDSSSLAPPADSNSTATGFRLVKSNLDQEQYPAYYPLAPGETISELETWMCRGRTSGFQEICENPNTVRTPATEPAPTK